MQSVKVLKWFMIIGLIIILLSTKIGQMVKGGAVVLFSKYWRLLPYIYAQAKHETGNFSSKVYLTDHNYFGIKFINGRRGQIATQGLRSPENDYYAHFMSDSASIVDLLKIFDAYKMPTSVKDAKEYATILKSHGYFGGPLEVYISALEKFLKTA